jgi:hypothetical protein
MATEWTEADKGAHVRFAQKVRDLRSELERAEHHRVEIPTRDIRQRLDILLAQLGAR